MSESDVYRRQILTYKIGRRSEGVYICRPLTFFMSHPHPAKSVPADQCIMYKKRKYNQNLVMFSLVVIVLFVYRCKRRRLRYYNNIITNFRTTNSMKLFYIYMSIFFNFSPISSHLYPLQVENCDSNSRLVVDEDDNAKLRPERVNIITSFK